MTRRRLAGLGLAALLSVMGCSGGSGAATTTIAPGTVLKVADLSAAVAAVEAARGGPQRYIEVNATPDGVNVFVSVEPSNELAYYYSGGRLEPPETPEPQGSVPFDLQGIDLGLGARLVEQTQARFPGSTVVSAALLQLPEGLRWALRSRSSRGGLLNVLFTPAGDLVSVTPAD